MIDLKAFGPHLKSLALATTVSIASVSLGGYLVSQLKIVDEDGKEWSTRRKVIAGYRCGSYITIATLITSGVTMGAINWFCRK